MDKLQLPHAKLLYFVSELHKQKEIIDEEKTKLKELIISNDARIFDYLESYEENSDEDKLKHSMLVLVRPDYEPPRPAATGQGGQILDLSREGGNEESTEASSPLGTALFEKKKKQKEHAQKMEALKEHIKPVGGNQEENLSSHHFYRNTTRLIFFLVYLGFALLRSYGTLDMGYFSLLILSIVNDLSQFSHLSRYLSLSLFGCMQ
eukprot:TRINITY_DN6625_c0_g1_i8.p1 TRINITY_DN6625_c0_g1~~TRINITY_DN6625_c0_g1_i8.p1  ORF type:complete len:206 (+),score=17.65 TRINITY_DN6625_c0_g1_i8:116-733(+)